MSLAIIARFYDLNEATVAASALRAAGLSPQVFDDHWASVNWIAGSALGGFRVALPEEELQAGLDMLRGLPVPEPLEPEDVIERTEAPMALALAGALLAGPEVGWAIGGGGRRGAFLWRRITAGVLLGAVAAAWLAWLLARLGFLG
jgi:hypothetical protein